MKHLLIIPVLLLVLIWGSVSAELAAQTRASSKPIKITADQMEADDNRQVVIFSGSVVARQDDLVLNCDTMHVYYEKKNSSAPDEGQGLAGGFGDTQTEIVRIEADGNVKVTRGGQVAEARKAVYRAKATPRTIILTGEPRVWKDKDYLTGKKIIFYVDENRSVVEGGKGERVNAVFYQSPGVAPPKDDESKPQEGGQ